MDWEESFDVYESVVQTMPDGALVADTDGVIRFANETTLSALGRVDVDDLVGESVFELTASLTAEESAYLTFERALERVLTVEGVDDEWVELPLSLPSRDVTAEYRMSPFAPNGELLGAVVVVRDVTERTEREAQFRRVTERISDGFFAVDREWRITYWNDTVAARVGKSADDVLGDVLWDEFPSIADTTFEEHYRRAMRTGEPTSFEAQLDDPLGYWVEVRAYPDEHGLSVFTRDVTEEHDRRQELTELKRQYETVFDNVRDALFLVDVDDVDDGEEFRYVRLNPAHEDATGVRTEDVQGKTPREAFESDFAQQVTVRYRQCLEVGEPISYTEDLAFDEGTRTWHTTLAPVVVDGEVTQLVGASRDVTERATYEERLRERNETLELLNRIVRHDIRNDMQLVLGMTSLVAERADEEVQGYLEKIHTAGNHTVELTTIIRDLMDALLSEGERKKAVNARRILEDEIDDINPEYDDAIVRIEGSLPDVDVWADELLASVFHNLLQNAIAHNDKEVAEVSVSMEERENSVQLSISDNGPGVPDDLKEVVFGKGEKGLKSSGTGIGLYLVNTLVDGYGGDVWIDDNDPTGATVHVVLQKAPTEPGVVASPVR